MIDEEHKDLCGLHTVSIYDMWWYYGKCLAMIGDAVWLKRGEKATTTHLPVRPPAWSAPSVSNQVATGSSIRDIFSSEHRAAARVCPLLALHLRPFELLSPISARK